MGNDGFVRVSEKATLYRVPGSAPYHVNTIRGTGKVYVSSRSDPVIWVVDQKSLKLTGAIKLPAGEGHQMAVMP